MVKKSKIDIEILMFLSYRPKYCIGVGAGDRTKAALFWWGFSLKKLCESSSMALTSIFGPIW
jgi:hypothetical protein